MQPGRDVLGHKPRDHPLCSHPMQHCKIYFVQLLEPTTHVTPRHQPTTCFDDWTKHETRMSLARIAIPVLQTLPPELLTAIVEYASFRGLRFLLHCPSEHPACLARYVLTRRRARPHARLDTIALLGNPTRERRLHIIDVAERFLGKECVSETDSKDVYVIKSVDTR